MLHFEWIDPPPLFLLEAQVAAVGRTSVMFNNWSGPAEKVQRESLNTEFFILSHDASLLIKVNWLLKFI